MDEIYTDFVDGCNDNLSLDEYSEYKEIMAEQESKLEDVSVYVSDLISTKRKLKSLVEKYQDLIPQKNELYKNAFFEYDKIREKRNKLFNNLLESVDRLNELIDDENDLNAKKCKLYDEYNIYRGEVKDFKLALNQCCILIKEYEKFDNLNDDLIKKLTNYYRKKWDILWVDGLNGIINKL